MQVRLCEVCCQRVSVHNDGYGTHFYLPMERRAIVREIAETLKRLSTDPNIQHLTATDALIHASRLITVDPSASNPEKAL